MWSIFISKQLSYMAPKSDITREYSLYQLYRFIYYICIKSFHNFSNKVFSFPILYHQKWRVVNVVS